MADEQTTEASPTTTPEPTPDYAAEAAAAKAELQALKGKLGGLNEYLSRADGDTIATAVSDYLRIKSDPRLWDAVNGKTTPAPAEEEYLTPEQKEIRELRQELRSLKSGHEELTLASGQQSLKGHLDRFVQDFPLEPNEIQAVTEHLSKTFDGWTREGETGRRALRNIQDPKNYKMVKNLLLSALAETSEATIFALGERREKRRRNRLEDFRTDEPSQTAGREEPLPEFNHKNAAMNALAAWEFAEANPERLRRMYRD